MKPLALLLLFISLYATGQQLVETNVTPLSADNFIGVDSYKNIYFTKEMVLHKKGPLGDFVFRDYQLGPIFSVDIINPLNVVVFYEHVNTIVFLDNRLNEIERVNFNNLPEFIEIGAATNAGNNRLWIFNVNTQQLELYNYRSGVKLVISQPIDEDFLSLASDFNYCAVLTSEKIMNYNTYGSFMGEIDLKSCKKIAYQNARLLALAEKELTLFKNINSGGEVLVAPLKLPIPENSIKDLQLTQDFLYIYDGINIRTFTLTKPKQ